MEEYTFNHCIFIKRDKRGFLEGWNHVWNGLILRMEVPGVLWDVFYGARFMLLCSEMKLLVVKCMLIFVLAQFKVRSWVWWRGLHISFSFIFCSDFFGGVWDISDVWLNYVSSAVSVLFLETVCIKNRSHNTGWFCQHETEGERSLFVWNMKGKNP